MILQFGVLGSDALVDHYIDQLQHCKGIAYSKSYSTHRYATTHTQVKHADEVITASDVVCILPSDQQYNFALKALLANKHIYLHQPFSFTEFQLRQMAKVAIEANVICYLPQNSYLCSDFFSQIKEQTPLYLEMYHNDASTLPTHGSIAQQHLMHDIDILFYIFDTANIRKSTVHSFTINNGNVDDLINVNVKFDNEVAAHLLISHLPQQPNQHYLEIYALNTVSRYTIHNKHDVSVQSLLVDCNQIIRLQKSMHYTIYNAIDTITFVQKLMHQLNLGTFNLKTHF